FENEEKYRSNINENVKKDGTRVWIHWSNRPIKDCNGKLVAILSIGTDITDKIKMERVQEYELKKSRALSMIYDLLVSPDVKLEDIEYATLEGAMDVTSSRAGFIARLGRGADWVTEIKLIHERGEERVKRAIVAPGVECKLQSLLDRLRDSGTICANSPEEYSPFLEIPDWHVKVERFIAAPILVAGEVVGVLSVANSERYYSVQDVELVSDVCRYCGFALQRVGYEKELALRENLYRTLFEIAPVPTVIVEG
ncbi:MAG: GAF domain-containing protein, partial [Candidatus Freyarchaeota archaeon]|nr:GAF domain-containing protein [Candidatus Jordarchaeia archaeon]